ncbi:MAG: heparan-alpha-glucosaminide N-acetyltransferase [Methanosarcinaceae archaeon]|nr:heparan-alpha-glucosaminide N-acetyltransferase [Methanosarcinaceae archaeon]
MDKTANKRFWEIDFLRGIAILLMIIFHALYDFNYFGDYNFNLHSGLWAYIGRASAITFIFVVGISLTLSHSRATVMKIPKQDIYQKYIKRGARIFSWGLIITLITWLFLKDGVIVFGILHFIGLSVILAYPFLRLHKYNLLIGAGIILTGLYLGNLAFDFPWLLGLGFKPYGFNTLDYFPILPWFGITLIGIFAGNLLYPNYTRKIDIKDYTEFLLIRLFCLLGRRSLLIYLIHQPVLIALLYLLGFVDIEVLRL